MSKSSYALTTCHRLNNKNKNNNNHNNLLVRKWLLLMYLCLSVPLTNATLRCFNDEFCQQQYSMDEAYCKEDGYCSNPYQQGCLITKKNDIKIDLPFEIRKRICNSDDHDDDQYDDDDNNNNNNKSNDEDVKNCLDSEWDFPEIRIHHGNWESSIFYTWMLQIIMMEIVQVPITVGLQTSDTPFASFYSPNNDIQYSDQAYPFPAVKEANTLLDCKQTDLPCAHVMPEVWSGQYQEWKTGIQEGYLNPVIGNGQVGRIGWYIPRLTAQRDDTLLSFYGLGGERNRQKLASTFPRPITWKDYCESISTNNCTIPNHIATRYPSTSEAFKYFDDDEASLRTGNPEYIGNFQFTDENNCTKNEFTCTGHFITPPCEWSATTDAHLYWNDIVGLSSNGRQPPHNAYTIFEMKQIYRAARANRENVILFWWQPEATVEEFIGSDYEFQRVLLPPPTNVCERNRPNVAQRCSMDAIQRRGNSTSFCDHVPHPTQKVIAKALKIELTEMKENLREQSPAFDIISNFRVTDLQFNEILRRWLAVGVDQYGNDARKVVCDWIGNNMEDVMNLIPQGHPRILNKSQENYYSTSGAKALLIAAAIFAGIVTFLILLATFFTFQYRKAQVFVYAQVYFVFLILFGAFLICLGALVATTRPSMLSCTSIEWLVSLGYTIELLPLLVKISALNKLFEGAKKCKRVKVTPRQMFQNIALLVCFVIIYLIFLTIFDAPRDRTFYESSQSAFLNNEIRVVKKCGTNVEYWLAITIGWEAILLLVATALAYQSRNVRQEFNESQSLGTMVYFHFLFLVLRITVFWLGISNVLPHPAIIAAMRSILLSLDCISALVIYLLPKFLRAMRQEKENSIKAQGRGGAKQQQQQQQQYNYDNYNGTISNNNKNNGNEHLSLNNNNNGNNIHHGMPSLPKRIAASTNPVLQSIKECQNEDVTSSKMLTLQDQSCTSIVMTDESNDNDSNNVNNNVDGSTKLIFQSQNRQVPQDATTLFGMEQAPPPNYQMQDDYDDYDDDDDIIKNDYNDIISNSGTNQKSLPVFNNGANNQEILKDNNNHHDEVVVDRYCDFEDTDDDDDDDDNNKK